MSIRKRNLLVSAALIAVLIAVSAGAIVAKIPATLMVIPARYRIVELSFDIARMHNVALVSYGIDQRKRELLLHMWNGQRWMAIGVDEFQSGSFLLGAPERIIAIGDEKTLPTALSAAPSWCPVFERLTSLDIGALINQLGGLLNFRDSEWRRLARKYDLSLTDLNAEKRRAGRYGAHSGAGSAPATDLRAAEDIPAAAPLEPVMPPATKASPSPTGKTLDAAPPMATSASMPTEKSAAKTAAPLPQDK
jgi:hypothetical protein